jgi:hypothetical protein
VAKKMPLSCKVEHHLTLTEFGLWEHYRKISRTTGRLFEDPENTAKQFAKASRTAIYRLRKKLTKDGWLLEVKKSKRGPGGRMTAAEYLVLDHDEWAAKHGKKDCHTNIQDVFQELAQPVPKMEPVSSPENGTRPTSPVPKTGLSSPEFGIPPVPPVDGSIGSISLEVKRESGGPGGADFFATKKSSTGTLQSKVSVPPVPKSGLVGYDPYGAALEYDMQRRDWGAKPGLGRALTTEESAELKRRDNLHLTPAQVEAEAMLVT